MFNFAPGKLINLYMKKYFLVLALFVGMSTYASDEVELVSGTIAMPAQTDDKDSDKEKKNYCISPHVGVGVGLATNLPEGLSFAPMRSWEIYFGLSYDYTPKDKLQTYSAGMGVSFRNFGTHSGKMLTKGGNYATITPDMTDMKSSIRVVSFSIPLLFTQKMGHKSPFRLTLGPVVNFNGTHINNHYSIGDDEYDVKTHKIGTRPVTVDILGILSFRALSVYCKYSPMSVLKNSSGMEFKSVSFGICF
jgi:hypothetical protein